MRKTASEIIRNLEMRVSRLEKSAGTIDFFKSYNRRAKEIVKEINGILPIGIFASKPEKVNKKSRQAKAIFSGFIGTANSLPVDFDLDRHYRIVFLSDDDYRSPLEYNLDDLYTQSSFTFYLDNKAVATAKNGIMDSAFMGKIKRALRTKIARLEKSAMMGVYVNVDSMGYYSAVDAFYDFQRANPQIRSTMYDNGSGYDISFEFDSRKHANAFKRFMMKGHYNQDKRFVRITES